MAIIRGFTGFEGGEDIYPFLTSNRVVFLDDGKAPTGQWSLYCNGPGNDTGSGLAIFPSFAPIGEVDGNFANANMRCRVVIHRTIPTNDDVMICGFGEDVDNITGGLIVNSTGHFAARAGEEIGVYSTAVLSIETEYIVEVLINVIDNAGNADITTTCNVYTSAGVLIETVSMLDNTGNYTTPYQILSCSVGHTDLNSCDYFVRFDDVFYVVEDEGLATLPTPVTTRVTRADPTGFSHQGSWTGNYLAATAIPFDNSDSLFSTAESGLTFTHASGSDLGITGVQGIQLYVNVKTSVNGTDKFLINTNTYDVAITGAYGAVPYTQQLWQTITDADFDTLVFGFKNVRETDLNLAQCFIEVFHSGTNYWPAEFAGVDSWKHKVITWVGDGSYQTITGVGFKSQLTIAKKYNGGSASPGLIKYGFMGGSRARSNVDATYGSRGIMALTDDGFILGPSSTVNENGMTYYALCIQDGGFAQDCYFFGIDAYVGSTEDGRDIDIDSEPDFVWINGGSVAYRTDVEVGDSSVPLSASATVTDLIQAINVDGFEVGTALNARDVIYYFFTIHNKSFLDDALFDFDSLVAAGASESVVTLFEPRFVIAKRIAAVDAQWRGTETGALVSTLWASITNNNTGITALNALGFDLGSTLVQAGQTTKWLAFSEEGEYTIGDTTPTVNAGPNQTINAFTPAVTAGSGTVGNYPCGVLEYSWVAISGPAASIIANPSNAVTSITFSVSGVYVFRLTASNGVSEAYDDVQITVVNAAPVVDAGPNQTVLLGTTVTMAGVVTDDGLPVPPGSVISIWSKLSGPGSVAFDEITSPTTDVTFSAAGVYVLQLSAFDGEKTTTDTVTITILGDCQLPSADPTFDCE